VISISDFKIATGDPKLLVCPKCRTHEFVVVTIKEKRKVSVVKLGCVHCRGQFDVMSGFVSA
jgi:hypothetical protein